MGMFEAKIDNDLSNYLNILECKFFKISISRDNGR